MRKLNDEQWKDLLKRLADASEKFAIASLAIGAYQGNLIAGLIGLAFLAVCIILSIKGGAK